MEESLVQRILEQKLATKEQVDEAMEIRSRMDEMGLRPRSVGEILCEKGYIDTDDLEAVLKEQHTVQGRDRIAGYELLELVGDGAMGSVYKAKQLSLDRIVALRVLDPELAKNAEYAERFLRDARAVARLSHTNLISGIDVGDEDGIKFVVMEYADGITAARLIRRGGPLDEERALSIGLQVARALDHAHRAGVVHGDVKPDNVIITSAGVAKLGDLGVARFEVEDEGEGHEHLGSPDSMSPEQARGADPSAASDAYGLGATLFQMLTGRPPFEGESREAVLARHLTEPAPAARTFAPELTDTTDAFLARCLAKAPDERYADGQALVAALEQAVAEVRAARGAAAPVTSAAASAQAPAAAAKPPAPVVRKRRRRR